VKSKIERLEKRVAAIIDHNKVIGQTRSGFPIHNHVNHPAHKNFGPEEHMDAMKAHQHHALQAQNHPLSILHGSEIKHHNDHATQHYLKSHDRPRPTKMSKIEELEMRLAEIGDRGGKIIGKTRSGKPIYDSANHAAHKGFSAGDHKDAMNAHAGHVHKLENHPLAAVHGDLIQHHKNQILNHSQQHKNLTNPEPAVYDLSKHF